MTGAIFPFAGGDSGAPIKEKVAFAAGGSPAIAEGAKRVDHVMENRKFTACSALPAAPMGAILDWESDIINRSDVNVSAPF
jgi:hypothetical protein